MSHTKELLLEKLTLLQKRDSELFGKKFRERFIEVRISKEKTLEVSGNHSEKTFQPFSKAPQYYGIKCLRKQVAGSRS